MVTDSKKSEELAALNIAYGICAAIRTAPKACGIDHLETAVITGDDKKKISDEMRRIGESFGKGGEFFVRDAGNVDASAVVVLAGAKYKTRGLNKKCALCGFAGCGDCDSAGATCIFTSMDLGIALGSAVAYAADNRADNRIMFTIGKAAASLGYLGEHKLRMGIPISISGKSPFFDR
jgi:uncharacterized ferredoxin-like protein